VRQEKKEGRKEPSFSFEITISYTGEKNLKNDTVS
jgi:hypothetical protein